MYSVSELVDKSAGGNRQSERTVCPGITGDAKRNPIALKFFPVLPQKHFTNALAVNPKLHSPCKIGPFGKPIIFAAFGSTCNGL